MLAALLVVWSVVTVAVVGAFENGQVYSVVCDKIRRRDCNLIAGKQAYGSTQEGGETHAYGTYVDEVNTDGWGKLWVHSDATVEGWYQAGFIEGMLTSERVYQHFASWFDYQFGAAPPTENTVKFVLDQYAYAKRLVHDHPNSPMKDDYFSTLGKLLAQFEGILAGVNQGAADASKQITLVQLLLLEAAGDLYDIIPAVDPEGFKLHIGKLSAQEFHDRWHKQISCSAIILVPDDFSDLYAGHNSWTSYQNMLRIYKNYDLDDGRYQTSHSSKPGVIYSKDDFYVLPRSKLVVMETTNGVMNKDLYKFVTPQSLLTWQRLPVINTIADSGAQWTDLMAQYNSGTYANQWMVLDTKRFVPGAPMSASTTGLLSIIEVAPNVAVANDVSSVLLTGRVANGKGGFFWPSYNIPYDKEVYVKTGFQQAYDTYGDSYSYTNCTRAQIFARDAPKVQSFDGVQHLLRYNDYTKDPLSQGNAAAAISSRYDLRTDAPKTYGGVDTKVTSFSRMYSSPAVPLASAQCGPTHDNIAPFTWSTSAFGANQVHLGQPDVFNFDFVEMDYLAH